MARSVDVPVWAVLLLALAVRLAWVAVVPVVPFSDPAAYDTFARTISQHGVYGWRPDDPTAFWAVGAPAIYAFGYWLFGPSYVVVIGLNLLATLGAWAVLPLKAIATGYWYVMILGAAAGLALTARRAGAVATLFGLPVLLIGYFAALHGVIFVSDRFHMPLNPIIAILAAVAFAELLGRKDAIGPSRSGGTGRGL